MSVPTMRVASAGRGVTQVVERCENAKASGYLECCTCLNFKRETQGYDVNKCSLRDNDLKKFPKKIIAKFPNMTIFNIEGNSVQEIPDEIGEWTEMKGMNLANNQVTVLPDAFYAMKNLTILDISGNLIEDLDAERIYSSFPKLIQLNVAGNPLKDEIKAKLSELRPQVLQIKF